MLERWQFDEKIGHHQSCIPGPLFPLMSPHPHSLSDWKVCPNIVGNPWFERSQFFDEHHSIGIYFSQPLVFQQVTLIEATGVQWCVFQILQRRGGEHVNPWQNTLHRCRENSFFELMYQRFFIFSGHHHLQTRSLRYWSGDMERNLQEGCVTEILTITFRTSGTWKLTLIRKGTPGPTAW